MPQIGLKHYDNKRPFHPKYCNHCGTHLVALDNTYDEGYCFSTCMMCGRYIDHVCDEVCRDFKAGKRNFYNSDTIPLDGRLRPGLF